MQEKIDLLPEIINSIQEKKGQKITIIDLANIPGASTEKFVICQGRSTAQVAAIADAVRDELLKKLGKKPFNYDGYRNSQWIIIDYGDLMVHIFLPEIRTHYNIEDLWSDGKFTIIEDQE